MGITSDAGPALPVRRWVRLGLCGVAAGLVLVFYIGWRLNPYMEDGAARTMETHTQLGLPPCKFVLLFGKPCPSCGMTTSFSLLEHGDLGGSLKANWVGTLLAIAWLAAIPWSLWVAWRGRYLGIRSLERTTYRAITVLTALMMLRWAVVLLQEYWWGR